MSKKESYFSTIVAYSYNEYIRSQLNLLSNSLYFSISYLDDDTYKLIQNLKDIYIKLPSIISSNSKEKENLALDLVNYKTTIEDKYRVLVAYQRELTHIVSAKQQVFSNSKQYLEDELGIDNPDEMNFDYSRLAEDCTNYVFKDNTSSNIQRRSYELLPYIPIKLTRDNYLDYCKRSIMHILVDDSNEGVSHMLSILSQILDGNLCPGYGVHFGDFKESVLEIDTFDNPTDLFESANMLNETFETLIDLLENMYKVICTLSNLILFDQLDFTDLTELNISFSDSYYSLKSIYTNSAEEDLILQSLLERVSDVSNELEKELVKAKATGQLNPLFNLMQTYLDMSITSLFEFNTRKDKNTSPDTALLVDNFITLVKNRLLELPNSSSRKIRMQYFISNLPFMMSKSSFKAYVEKGLTNSQSTSTSILTALQISNILETNGYFPDAPEIPITEDNLDLDDEADRFLREHDKH